MGKSVFYILLLSVALSGCNKQLENFVKEAVIDTTTPITQNPGLIPTDSEKTIKISPGHGRVISTNMSATATITPSVQGVASSGSASARISIQRSRVE